MFSTLMMAVAGAVAVTTTDADAQIVPVITAAAVVVYFQRALKGFKWYKNFVDALPGADKWAHRLFAAIGALVAAVGIHVTFTGSILAGGTFTGTYPDLWTMLHGLGEWIRLYIFQQLAYDATKDKAAAAAGGQ